MYAFFAALLFLAPVSAEKRCIIADLTTEKAVGRSSKPGANDALDPNLLRNPDFEHGFEAWTLEGTMGGGSAKMDALDSVTTLPEISGKIVRFHIQEISHQNWHLRFYQGGLDLEDDKPYVLTFWARADHKRPLSVQASVEDWHGIGLAADNIAITPTWRKFTLTFRATRTLKARNRLTFLLGDELGTVDLGGIRLRHSAEAGTRPNPPSNRNHTQQPSVSPPAPIGAWASQADGSSRRYRYTFNADGTGSVQTIDRPRNPDTLPHTPTSNPFRWYIAPGERNIVIGSRKFAWSLRRSGKQRLLVLMDRQGKSRVLYGL